MQHKTNTQETGNSMWDRIKLFVNPFDVRYELLGGSLDRQGERARALLSAVHRFVGPGAISCRTSFLCRTLGITRL